MKHLHIYRCSHQLLVPRFGALILEGQPDGGQEDYDAKPLSSAAAHWLFISKGKVDPPRLALLHSAVVLKGWEIISLGVSMGLDMATIWKFMKIIADSAHTCCFLKVGVDVSATILKSLTKHLKLTW